MLSATYDMKALKKLDEIDAFLKTTLVKILGLTDEEKLSDATQNLDLNDLPKGNPDNPKTLLKILLDAEGTEKEAELKVLAIDISAKLAELPNYPTSP